VVTPLSTCGFGRDAESDWFLDVSPNALGTDARELREFRPHELLFRVDAEQSVDDEVYVPVSTEV
jgi:hypothetical protein